MNREERRRNDKIERRQPTAILQIKIQEAVSLLQNGQFKQAERKFTRLLKTHPQHPDALHFQGVVMYKQGRFKESMHFLEASVSVADDYAEAHNSLGIILLEGRNFDKAIKHFSRALEIRPEFVGAKVNLGASHQSKSDFILAEEAYFSAIELDPSNVEAFYRLASVHLALMKSEQALEASNGALNLAPSCQHALAYKAISLQFLDKEHEAHQICNHDVMIFRESIVVPSNFANLNTFNGALSDVVRGHPSLIWEPYNRVTRGGAVTGDLLAQHNRVVASFEKSLRRLIDKYIDNLKKIEGHPFFGNIPSAYDLTLIASMLKSGGKHPSHLHESAWLSGVYYVAVPDSIEYGDKTHAGWLEFGRPDVTVGCNGKLNFSLQCPEPGLALLFPSYFFHGTIPFSGRQERIGIAFDVYTRA